MSLTEADRAYLKALEAWLDMYPEMRTTEEPALSAFRKSPVDGLEEIRVRQVQVPSWSSRCWNGP